MPNTSFAIPMAYMNSRWSIIEAFSKRFQGRMTVNIDIIIIKMHCCKDLKFCKIYVQKITTLG